MNRVIVWLIHRLFASLLIVIFCHSLLAQPPSRHRLIVLADMGNEADEEQQMIHLMMYSNEFEIEGLIAVTGKFLHPGHREVYRRTLHPELFMGIIDGYEQVVENLRIHSNAWPDPGYLRSVVATGQPGYGIESTGEGKRSEGSDLIVRALKKEDERPVYIVVNAGSNTLAQALIDIEAEHGKAEMENIIRKIRVYENGAQDNAGAWICAKYPGIHWIRSNYQTYCYGGPGIESVRRKGWDEDLGPHTWKPYPYSAMGQHHWALEHVIGDHGVLGRCYPLRQTLSGKIIFIEGGGTVPWLSLVHQGFSDVDHPHWGGWSGRFTREKIINVWSKHASVKVDEENYGPFLLYTEDTDQWTNPETGETLDGMYVPVWRWRQAYFNDFQCRMDWCVASYEAANHPPVAALNGDPGENIHFRNCHPDEVIRLDATSSSDPDGDELEYLWWIYAEAGTYTGDLLIENADAHLTQFRIPEDAAGTEIHIILEISDKNAIASLCDYRRLVLTVHDH